VTSEQIASQLELELMENISKTLKGGNIGKATWQLQKLADVGKLTEKNRKTIFKYISILDKTMQEEVSTAMNAKLSQIDKVLIGAGMNAGDASMIGIKEMIAGYSRSVAGEANLIGNNLLRAADQVYRDTLAKTTQATLSGINTPQEAMKKTISNWSKKGLPVLQDKAGRYWQPDSYVNMQVRTAQTAGMAEMTIQRNRDFGNDLIEIDSHVGARPGCEPYQGKVYSMSGKHGKFPALSSTTYGDADGLFGINCTHNMYPYVEGLSEKTYNPVKKKRNEEAYKNSQRQRLLERRIRQSKREVASLKALGEDTKQASKLLQSRTAMMEDFIKQTGRTRYEIKESV